MRKCIDCKVEKALEEFPKNGKSRRTRCAECYRVYNTAVKNSGYDPEKNRAKALQDKYGLTVEQYNEIYVAQRGRCALCFRPETRMKHGKVSALAVDHDHSCCPGKKSCGECIRGLLCYRCNMMLGFARDNAEVLQLGAEYLNEHKRGRLA